MQMTVAEVQQLILDKTGLKTSVRRPSTGSMKGYSIIRPMYQNGTYPYFPFDFVVELRDVLKGFDYAQGRPLMCLTQDINIYGIEGEPISMKKESKPKPIDTDSPQSGWGSKNSQMRLDKTAARHAAKIRRGVNTVTYW